MTIPLITRFTQMSRPKRPGAPTCKHNMHITINNKTAQQTTRENFKYLFAIKK